MNMSSARKHLAGFSLIEMAIVILITGILMVAGLSLLKVKQDAAQAEATLKHQEAIKQALINYLGKNKRLPCPGNISGAELRPDPTPASLPPCSQYSGIVPYQELGLDRSVALDGWENFISYVVTHNINPAPPSTQPTSPPIQQPAPAPLLTTAWLYTYDSITTSGTPPHTKTTRTNPANTWSIIPNPPTPWPIFPDSAFWPSTSTGGITVTDGTNAIADPVKATGAVVVLISYGRNGYGAFNIKGSTNDATAAGADEKTNATPITGTAPALTAKVIKRDATDSTSGGGAFDDIVMLLSAQDLVGPLVANGTLQASSQAALKQANNIVLGGIATFSFSKGCGGAPKIYVPTFADLVAFPNNAWGVTYQPILAPQTAGNCIDFSSLSTTATNAYSTTGTTTSGVNYLQNTAYVLTAGDGSYKIVTINELAGIITNSNLFN
jgi:prepilin-type N-terminal cleavage/methylation domain-containing protein